jgi:P27 family predicted phage terminase small subunit
MGLRGPAKKDKALRLVGFTKGVPVAPPWIDRNAKREYARITQIILRSGESLELVDMAALALYAQAYSDVARLTKQIRKEGETLPSVKTGQRYLNPSWTILAAARNQLMQATEKLGFSPHARSRITTPDNAKKKDGNPVAALLASVSSTTGPGNLLRS